MYLGVRKCLLMTESSCDIFYLTVNIDGIPVYKSTKRPIFCSINSLPPMIVALYVGSSKPASVQEFLADFVSQSNGFVVNNDSSAKPVILTGFVCDAPARAFIKYQEH